MGWISKRHMECGGSIGGRKGPHKGPLRKIVSVQRRAASMFDYDSVTFECGHEGRSYGGLRGRCRECGKGDPRYTAQDESRD